MTLATLQRLGGSCLYAGGALMAVYSVAFATVLPIRAGEVELSLLVVHPAWTPLAAVALAAIVLLMLGFAGLYTRLFASGGAVALAGFALVEVACLLEAIEVSWDLFVPVLAGRGPYTALLDDPALEGGALGIALRVGARATVIAGVALLTVALVRSREFPVQAGPLVAGGALLYGIAPALGIAGTLVGITLFAAGCIVVGVALRRAPACPAGTVARVLSV